MVLSGTGSIEGGTGQYMMVLGQYRSVVVDTLWYWSVRRGTGSYMMILDQYGSILVGTL